MEALQTLINAFVVLAVGLFLARMTSNLRHELKTEIAELRVELKAEIAELRVELKAEIAELRADLRAEIREVRSDLTRVALAVHAEPRLDSP